MTTENCDICYQDKPIKEFIPLRCKYYKPDGCKQESHHDLCYDCFDKIVSTRSVARCPKCRKEISPIYLLLLGMKKIEDEVAEIKTKLNERSTSPVSLCHFPSPSPPSIYHFTSPLQPPTPPPQFHPNLPPLSN